MNEINREKLRELIAKAPEQSWERAGLEFLVNGTLPQTKFKGGVTGIYTGDGFPFLGKVHPDGAMLGGGRSFEVRLLVYSQGPQGGYLAFSMDQRNGMRLYFIIDPQALPSAEEKLHFLCKPIRTISDNREENFRYPIFVPEDWNYHDVAYREL